MTLCPVQLDDESPQAFRAFKTYVELGEQRSQRKVGSRLAISRQLVSRWSARHRWMERLRSMQMDAALASNGNANDADAQAKLEEARERERLKTEHIKRTL